MNTTPNTIGVAMLGYAFMGKAHSRAFREASYLEPALMPRLVSISGRTAEKVEEARRLTGWEDATTNWREQVADERVQLFDNGGPNDLHAEPTIQAARNGKHVLCEKPLGRSAEEAHTIWRAAEEAAVVHMCGFNYRFVPAVRLAREIVESGDLGELFHFRARYLQSWGVDAPPSWRFDKEAAGSGALGDLGAHIVDLGRFLIGEPNAVSAVVRTFIDGHGVDDSFAATVEFENGVVGTLEASRLATGRINQNTFEINGSRGSVVFDVERLNELQVARGRWFERVLVTEPDHPFMDFWWPPGHIVGWGTPSRTRFTTSWLRSLGRGPSLRTAPPSRTATAARRSAMPSSARRRAASGRRSATDEDQSRHLGVRRDGHALRARRLPAAVGG